MKLTTTSLESCKMNVHQLWDEPVHVSVHTGREPVTSTGPEAPSPDARCAAANVYLKKIIQALQDYNLTIWDGRSAALRAQNQDTEHEKLNHDMGRLYKLKDTFPASAKQYFNIAYA